MINTFSIPRVQNDTVSINYTFDIILSTENIQTNIYNQKDAVHD